MTIVDKDGNALVMTTTVESGFGSFHMTQGFILNNQLTDFSADADRRHRRADRQPRRRRQAAAQLDGADARLQDARPTAARGDFYMGTGSPGGSTIIQYVVKTVVGVLDWGLDAQQATSMVDFGAANSPTTNVGGEHPNINATNERRERSARHRPARDGPHGLDERAVERHLARSSACRANGTTVLTGGADPRREGVVLGDAIVP